MELVIEKLKAEATWYRNGYKKFKDHPFPESQRLAKDCKKNLQQFNKAIKILKRESN